MSELQIALLVVAGVVLAALYLAGKWQDRRLLRRLSENLSGDVGDALLGDPPHPHAQSAQRPSSGGRGRIEPHLEAASAADAAPVARRSEWIEDPMLDCVLELRCARSVDGVSFIDAAVPLAGSQWPMPVRFVVWDARAQQWVHPDRFGYYTRALAAIQLANRRHVLSEEQIERFVSTARKAAIALDADCDPPDVARLAAGARELDQLCARFDVRIGLTLESASGAWTEARVAGAAKGSGLQPLSDFRWPPPHQKGPAVLALATPAPGCDRVSLELDVPATCAGSGAVQQLFGLGNQLGAQLNARIVDDNRRPIDSQSVAAIEAQQ